METASATLDTLPAPGAPKAASVVAQLYRLLADREHTRTFLGLDTLGRRLRAITSWAGHPADKPAP